MTPPQRYPDFLRDRYRAIFAYTGLVCLIVSILILLPAFLLPFYPEEAAVAWGFVLPALLLGIPSVLAWRVLAPRAALSLTYQEGAVIVVLAWLLAILVGDIPFLAVSGLDFTQAVFESTSGWSTAGLSVIDVETAPRLVLFYRSVTQLAGGAGLAIIMVSALAGPLGPGLSTAEGREEQLLPHVVRSAKLVLTLYGGYVLAGFLALRVAGMSWFDAINHAFTALSTGGFSTHTASIGYWQSPVIEGVIIVLMLLGTLNLMTAYALVQGKFLAVYRNSELRQTLLLLVVFCVVLLAGVTGALYPTMGESVRNALFNTVASLSTTGYANVDLRPWDGLGWLMLIVMMIIGGGSGSTAGAMKQYRVHVLAKGLLWEFRRRLLPSRAIAEPDVWRGERRYFITDAHLRSVSLYVFLYVGAFAVGSAIMASYGYPLGASLFEFASALGTVGLSIGITAPDAPAGILWLETCAMLLGRLEFFTVIIGLIRLGRDIPAMVKGWPQRRAGRRQSPTGDASEHGPGAPR